MATKTFLILAVSLAIIVFSTSAFELNSAEEQMQFNEGAPVIEEATIVKGDITSNAIAEGEALLSQCAKKFIKDCEIGRQCRQIVCPAETTSEVSLGMIRIYFTNSTFFKSFLLSYLDIYSF